jgi:hypothetical protein
MTAPTSVGAAVFGQGPGADPLPFELDRDLGSCVSPGKGLHLAGTQASSGVGARDVTWSGTIYGPVYWRRIVVTGLWLLLVALPCLVLVHLGYNWQPLALMVASFPVAARAGLTPERGAVSQRSRWSRCRRDLRGVA